MENVHVIEDVVQRLRFDFSKTSDKSKKKAVVGIVCPSYSGSTLLTALLGAHPQIFGAGELHWLLSDDRKRVQNIIANNKSLLKTGGMWESLYGQNLTPASLYDSVFAEIDQYIMIDASKRSHFYEKMAPLNPSKHLVYVYLLKHPMRLLSSHIMHRWEKSELKHMERAQVIDHLLADLHHQIVYQHLISGKIGCGNVVLTVQYEQLVTQTRETLQYILSALGLAFEESMLAYDRKKQHLLGGNAGPRSQISQAQSGGSAHFDNKIQSDFYERLDGIKMDNNYRVFFTPEEIDRLNRTEQMLTLINLMGYQPIS